MFACFEIHFNGVGKEATEEREKNMSKIIKRKIIPFTDFWINCESTILHSLLITLDERYRVLAYNNCYTYEQLYFHSPSGKAINEVRIKQEINDLWNAVLKNKQNIKWANYDKAVEDIKSYLRQGKIVMVGVDLFYWIPKNMCYGKHHVDHYAIINGYDEENDIFFVMDTDNVKYQEFQLSTYHVVQAIEHCDLEYDAHTYDLCEKEEIEPYMISHKELLWHAKRIYKSLRPLQKKYFWLMNEEDYKAGFYRDMCVMYILQINCQMKANRLLFEYLLEEEWSSEMEELKEECFRLEIEWTNIRNKLSKTFFSENCVAEMTELGERMKQQFTDERKMWKVFMKVLV